MKEKPRHRTAFEIYFNALQVKGSKTGSIEEVSEQCHINITTAWKWQKIFDWDTRAAIREANIRVEIEKRTDTTITENRMRYLKLYHRLLSDAEADPDIKVGGVRDLKMVIDGALILQDQPSEHAKKELEGSVIDRIRKYEAILKSDSESES